MIVIKSATEKYDEINIMRIIENRLTVAYVHIHIASF